ncbi:MAG: hypothetical protein QXH27_02190 [Candidatus Micrarchaeia archaeon]
MWRKAQVFSMDLIVSFVIALFLAAAVFQAASSTNAVITASERSRDLSLASAQALALLVQSPGNPADWSFANAKSVGLAQARGVLNPERVSYFFSQSPSDYNISLSLLGFNREGAVYDYNLEIINASGSTLYSLNRLPQPNTPVASRSAVSVLNSSLVLVKMTVWVRP